MLVHTADPSFLEVLTEASGIESPTLMIDGTLRTRMGAVVTPTVYRVDAGGRISFSAMGEGAVEKYLAYLASVGEETWLLP